MVSPSRSLWFRLSVAVALLLIAVCAALAHAQIPVVVNYNTQDETAYDDTTASVTFSGANALCMANGMNLISGESNLRIQRVWTLFSRLTANPVNRASYSLLSQKPTPENMRCTMEQTTFASSGAPSGRSSFYCAFTAQYGLFSRYVNGGNFANQPGVQFSAGSWKYYSTGEVCNAPTIFGSMKWDTASSHPAGLYYTAILTNNAISQAAFANVDSEVPATFYVPRANFWVACEAQRNLADPPITFAFTQPTFVKGYKELTWVQEHWWVVFLIIAVVILIVLFAILIFCCTTMAPPKEQPPIAPMVMRERSGQAYVNASDDDDSTPKSRDLNLGNVRNGRDQADRQQQQRQSSMMVPMAVPMPMVDPDDLIQATPSIYSQDEVMQTAEGDSMASDDNDESDDGHIDM